MNSESEEISFVWICLVQVSTNPERDSMRVRINSTMDCSASLISFHGKASTGPESNLLKLSAYSLIFDIHPNFFNVC